MWQLLENNDFISQIASMKANFFLSITQFCIAELSARIDGTAKNDQLQDEEIYKQIESLDDPILQKLFVESDGQCQEAEQQQQKEQQVINKIKKGKTKIKPFFTTHKPKAPTTSYLLFLHQNKANIAARHKLTNISQVTKVASDEWRKMSQYEKQKYFKKSEAEKTRYREAMVVYKEKYADEIKQEKRRRQSNYKNKWLEKKKKIDRQKQSKKIENQNQNSQHQINGENSSDNYLKNHVNIRQSKKQNNVILIDQSLSNENCQDQSRDLTQI